MTSGTVCAIIILSIALFLVYLIHEHRFVKWYSEKAAREAVEEHEKRCGCRE